MISIRRKGGRSEVTRLLWFDTLPLRRYACFVYHGSVLSFLSQKRAGMRNEDKPIKISSWNHYRLVEQEVEASSQLASSNDHASCGCASFSCFGCSSARLDEPYSRKVSLVHQSKSPSDSSSSSDRGKLTINDAVKWDERKTCLKSNMKKPSIGYSMVCEADDARELLAEADNKTSCYTVGRKVQWTDKCGKELAEIREFEARYV
ncbi:hypothetical protein BHE74_00005599 [Ensete ventricosum]|nr:hypothetical protein GW17_00013754 [Ensete ventricosum]RWW85705.1 hypothetical protein BHE74_00005599 [Ensete ventricosum]